MKLNRKSAAALVLVKGQIWKLQDSHIEILEMGKRLASYKHFRTLDNRRAPTQLANIASVQEMLTTHKAVLLDTKDGNAAIKKITKVASPVTKAPAPVAKAVKTAAKVARPAAKKVTGSAAKKVAKKA